MVKGQLQGALAVSLSSVTHTFVSGLPEKLGGKDEGPTPHDLIEAGLVACTILTCQMYANRKSWKLTSTEVSVKILSENKAAAQMRREITFKGELSEEQRARLLEIANNCPIHNLLVSNITIDTVLNDVAIE